MDSLRFHEWIVVVKDSAGGTIRLEATGQPWRESFTRDNIVGFEPFTDGRNHSPMDAAYGYARHLVRLERDRVSRGHGSGISYVRVFPRSYPGHGESLYVNE